MYPGTASRLAMEDASPEAGPAAAKKTSAGAGGREDRLGSAAACQMMRVTLLTSSPTSIKQLAGLFHTKSGRQALRIGLFPSRHCECPGDEGIDREGANEEGCQVAHGVVG